MGENSKIQWCDHSFSGWLGCQKVSPGCDNCYAERDMDHRFHRVQWGPHGERVRTTPQYWKQPLKWNEQARREGRRLRIFSGHYSDWLDNKVPQQWRVDLAELIVATPYLTWMLLTKRIENYQRLAPWEVAPSNVWILITAEDQEHYDRRREKLFEIIASGHFVSYEPAIGPLKLTPGNDHPDWIICGGESGRHPRPKTRSIFVSVALATPSYVP